MGHSPVALPVLLSEVLVSMCSPRGVPEILVKRMALKAEKSKNDQEIRKNKKNYMIEHGIIDDVIDGIIDIEDIKMKEELESKGSVINTNNIATRISSPNGTHGGNNPNLASNTTKKRKTHIGVVSGSFDGISGKVVIGELKLLLVIHATEKSLFHDMNGTVASGSRFLILL